MRGSEILREIQSELAIQQLSGNYLVGPHALSVGTDLFPERGPDFDAPCIFPALGKAIRDATQEVLLNFYTFDPESDGAKDLLEGLRALVGKAKVSSASISVKILVNQRSGFPRLALGGDTDWQARLISEFQSLGASVQIELRVYPHAYIAALHSKQAVIDGKKVVILTGDPKAANNYRSGPMIHHEIATELYSLDLARAAQAYFEELWTRGTPIYPVSIATPAGDAVRSVTSEERASASDMESVNGPSVGIPATFDEGKLLVTSIEDGIPEKKSDLMVTALEEEGALYLSKPPCEAARFLDKQAPYLIAALALLKRAESSVMVMMSNLNNLEVITALVGCLKRGVLVQLVLGRYHCEFRESVPGAGGTNEWAVGEILRQVKEECTPEQLKQLDIRWACDEQGRLVLSGRQPGTIHCKDIIVDEKFVLTGSTLADRQSLERNAETDVLICSTRQAAYHRQFFNQLFSRGREAGQPFSDRLELERSVSAIEERGSDAAPTLGEVSALLKQYQRVREEGPSYETYSAALMGSKGRSREAKVGFALSVLEKLQQGATIELADVLRACGENTGGLLKRILTLLFYAVEAVIPPPSSCIAEASGYGEQEEERADFLKVSVG